MNPFPHLYPFSPAESDEWDSIINGSINQADARARRCHRSARSGLVLPLIPLLSAAEVDMELDALNTDALVVAAVGSTSVFLVEGGVPSGNSDSPSSLRAFVVVCALPQSHSPISCHAPVTGTQFDGSA